MARKPRVEAFFEYARARHAIYLRRAAGLPRPWTKDKIFQRHSFTNVFRELDKTTAWFRKHVRDPLRNRPEVLLATVVFRMFNRIEVGEAIFCQQDMLEQNATAFDLFLGDGDVRHLRRNIKNVVGPRGPYATGAYIISSPPGYSKLDGILRVIKTFNEEQREWRGLGAGVLDTMGWSGEEGAAALLEANYGELGMEATYQWLRQFPYLGTFHSYEIVCDLRYTALLREAPDKMTWCSVGPGARRGLNRIFGRGKKRPDGTTSWNAKIPKDQALDEIRTLLHLSQASDFWPQWKRGGYAHRNYELPKDVEITKESYPAWEMREVEHTLCEFDKYERTRTGEGRPRGRFNGG